MLIKFIQICAQINKYLMPINNYLRILIIHDFIYPKI